MIITYFHPIEFEEICKVDEKDQQSGRSDAPFQHCHYFYPNVSSSRFVSFLILVYLVSLRSVQLHGKNAIYTGEINKTKSKIARNDDEDRRKNERKEKKLDGLEKEEREEVTEEDTHIYQ